MLLMKGFDFNIIYITIYNDASKINSHSLHIQSREKKKLFDPLYQSPAPTAKWVHIEFFFT